MAVVTVVTVTTHVAVAGEVHGEGTFSFTVASTVAPTIVTISPAPSGGVGSGKSGGTDDAGECDSFNHGLHNVNPLSKKFALSELEVSINGIASSCD